MPVTMLLQKTWYNSPSLLKRLDSQNIDDCYRNPQQIRHQQCPHSLFQFFTIYLPTPTVQASKKQIARDKEKQGDTYASDNIRAQNSQQIIDVCPCQMMEVNGLHVNGTAHTVNHDNANYQRKAYPADDLVQQAIRPGVFHRATFSGTPSPSQTGFHRSCWSEAQSGQSHRHCQHSDSRQ